MNAELARVGGSIFQVADISQVFKHGPIRCKFAVTGDATPDEIRVVRSVIEAISSLLRERGHLEVLGLEDHVHGRGHLDDLARHQAQLLVVVQHLVVFGFRVSALGVWDSGFGIRVSGFGFRDSEFVFGIEENRVHVLDPDGVDGPVEHDPLPVHRLV